MNGMWDRVLSAGRRAGRTRAFDWVNSVAIVAVAGVGCVLLVRAFDGTYPVAQWHIFRVLVYHAVCAIWCIACIGVGSQLLFSSWVEELGAEERLVLSFPVGVLVFGCVTFVVGVAGVLRSWFFVGGPVLLLVVGGTGLWRHVRPTVAELSGGWRGTRLGAVDLAALLIGAFGLALVYLPILTPQNIQYDAAWYHLPVAQQYAVEGAIRPFKEGWYLATYPHLASILYAWCLLAPASLADRLALCAHFEFYIFLATVFAVPSVVRRLEPRVGGRFAWVVVFLFPGLLVYDSNLSVGADHICALFAPAMLLTLGAAWLRLPTSLCVALGVLAAGAAWTKYSAIALVLPVFAFVAVRALWLTVRPGSTPIRDRLTVLSKLPLIGLAFALAWAPHWLPNWLWHGDPLYPLLYRHLPAHPWSADGQMYFEDFNKNVVWRVSHDWSGAVDAVRAAFSVGFSVREYDFHGREPTFGFLFALTLPLLPFVRPRGRVWLAYALCIGAVMTWMWVYHRDRYLQALVPWMAISTAAVLALLWQRGVLTRIAVGALVFLQLGAALDLAFLPAHRLATGHNPMRALFDNVGAARKSKGAWTNRSNYSGRVWLDIRDAVPEGGRVLIHDERMWMGLERSVVVDDPYGQAGIRYGEMGDTRGVHQFMMARGITHVVTGQHHDIGTQAMAGQLLFWDYLRRDATSLRAFGPLMLWRVASDTPRPLANRRVLVLSCSTPLPGVYQLEDLARVSEPPAGPREPLPDAEAALLVIAGTSQFAISAVPNEACAAARTPLAALGFTQVYARDGLAYWSRLPSR